MGAGDDSRVGVFSFVVCEDVDIAEESANLAKYSILTQAAAAMVAQANSTNDVALMLLR